MSSKKRELVEEDEDHRAQWERPAFRRLAAEDAQGTGTFQDEGNPNQPGMKSGGHL